jgi:heptosyltransferase-2
MKVLVVQQRYGIGDMLIFLPYLKAIAQKNNVKISLLAKKTSRSSELFEGENFLDEIINLDSTNDGIPGFFKLSKEIKKRKFDKVYIFNGSIRYKFLAIVSGIKHIHQYPLFTSKDIIFHTAKVFTEALVGKILSTEPNLLLNNDDVSKAKNTYNINDQTKNIVLGISASGPTKRWDIENYIELASQLNQQKKCRFFIAAGKDDLEIIDKIKLSKINKNCITMEKLSISNILPIIKNCNLYIGNDTGFMHMSAALGIKSIGIFMDSPAYSYSGYSKNIIPIVPQGETIESTTHDTMGKDKISLEEVLTSSIKYLG